MRRPVRSAAGFSVAELLVAMTVGTVLAAGSLPMVGAARASLATRAAARALASAFREAAAVARARQRTLAWEVAAAPFRMRLVEDGDGDGVRRDDVEQGVDQVVSGWRGLADGSVPVEAVVGCRCPDIDGGGDLAPGDRGVRFGTSGFVSFAARGTASSGTLYLSSADGPAMAVRVLGATGRVRTLEYVAGGGGWTEQ